MTLMDVIVTDQKCLAPNTEPKSYILSFKYFVGFAALPRSCFFPSVWQAVMLQE